MAKDKVKIVKHPLLRTAIWAICVVILLVFATNIFLNYYTRHNDYYSVPDLAGLHIKRAENLAKQNNLILELVDSLYVPAYNGGVILEQRPAAGSKVKSGRRVFLTINSYNQRMIKVPYVAGYSLRQAKNNLELSGLVIKELIYRNDIATNNVLEQYYNDQQIVLDTNLELEYGSAITLVVGAASNAPAQNMPKLIGLQLKDAQSRLWELGLNVGKIHLGEGVSPLTKSEARVYAQSKEHACDVELGTKINLSITHDASLVARGNFQADSTYKARLREAERLKKLQDSIDAAALVMQDIIMEEFLEQTSTDSLELPLTDFFDL